MVNETTFVTRLDLIESQQALKLDVTRKIDTVDDKVDNLRDMVLPLLESSKQTAENTRKIAESMDKFTDEQRSTNGEIYTRLNGHDITLTEYGVRSSTQSDVKKANAGVIVAVLALVGILITGMFGLAPYIFN